MKKKKKPIEHVLIQISNCLLKKFVWWDIKLYGAIA